MLDDKLYLLGDVCNVLGCKPYHVTYLLKTSQIPEPKRIGGRRVFTIADLDLIAQKINAGKAIEGERGSDG